MRRQCAAETKMCDAMPVFTAGVWIKACPCKRSDFAFVRAIDLARRIVLFVRREAADRRATRSRSACCERVGCDSEQIRASTPRNYGAAPAPAARES